jgi:hypothetical protein
MWTANQIATNTRNIGRAWTWLMDRIHRTFEVYRVINKTLEEDALAIGELVALAVPSGPTSHDEVRRATDKRVDYIGAMQEVTPFGASGQCKRDNVAFVLFDGTNPTLNVGDLVNVSTTVPGRGVAVPRGTRGTGVGTVCDVRGYHPVTNPGAIVLLRHCERGGPR